MPTKVKFSGIISHLWSRWVACDKVRSFQVIAIILIAISSFYAINTNANDSRRQNAATLRDQRAGCVRTNEFRQQINDQSKTFLEHNVTTYELFNSISKSPQLPNDLRQKITEATAKYDRTYNKYEPLPLINCSKAYSDRK